MSKKLLIDISEAAKDALTGLVMCNSGLVLLENQPVIMRRDHNELKGKVKIISGCGTGHEPSPAGFVGHGMLTAAVVGNICTAPSSSAVLQAIRELGSGHSEGVLLIVINYAECRMSFTVAMERAENEGIYVKMLVVDDDCSLQVVNKQQGCRGLAGIILVSKIAGAMAEEGKRLDEIYDTCRLLATSDIATLAVGLLSSQGASCKHCTNVSANDDFMQLGVGLHGECCTQKFHFVCTKKLVHKMLLNMVGLESKTHIQLAASSMVVVLINNMGGFSKLEEYIFAKEVLKQLAEMNITVARSYCGVFLTSLEVSGFSITLLKITKPEVLKYLDAPALVTGWPQHFQCEYIITSDGFPLPKENLPYTVASKWQIEDEESRNIKLNIGPKISLKSAQSTLQVIGLAADAISACERQLNLFDCQRGNGDKGTVLKRAAVAIKNAIKTKRITGDRPYAILQTLSHLCENSMGGTLGTLYSVFFAAAAKPFCERTEDCTIDGFLWLEALRAGIKAIMHYAYVLVGDITLLDSLNAAANALEKSLNESPDEQVDAIKKAAMAAEEEAQRTVCKKSRINVASNHADPLFMPDPGAHAVGLWLRGLYEGCRQSF